MKWIVGVFALWIVVACSGTGHSKAIKVLGSKKTVHAEGTMADGPVIQDKANLLSWLQSTSTGERQSRQMIRLPVAVRWAPRSPVTAKRQRPLGPWALETCIGGLNCLGDPSAVTVTLDDTALGLRLSDQLPSKCTETTDRCAVWLEGYWGALISPSPVKSSEHTFAVLRVRDRVLSTREPLRAYTLRR